MNMKRLKVIFAIILFTALLSDFIVHHGHAEYIWEEIPGFGAIFGLFSCIIIVLVSKFLGHHWLMKKEDYYD